MLKVKEIFLNGGRLASIHSGCRIAVSDTAALVFSWSVISSIADNTQTACRVTVYHGTDTVWDSDWRQQKQQQLTYDGPALLQGAMLSCKVQVRDKNGECGESEGNENVFAVGIRKPWCGKWIVPTQDQKRHVIYYRREFVLDTVPQEACLYLAGIGYHCATLNGHRLDDAVLDPAHSNYAKTVYYTVYPLAARLLQKGKNVLCIEVADGWRRNESEFVSNAIGDRVIEFEGRPMLSAMLDFFDGNPLVTDETWQWKYGAITEANIFDGEVYDARYSDPQWNTLEEVRGFSPVCIVPGPGGEMCPMALEPIREKEVYPAIDIFQPKPGMYVVDFGQNIAGVICLRLPAKMVQGQKITVSFMEFLDEDGTLYMAPLRGAKQTDTYIASGDKRDLPFWQSRFTYHGFRYAQVTGLEGLTREDIHAIALYTDIAAGSSFRCGDPMMNSIHQNAVQTEKSNIHSILTDCPQRDERMGWMNDATVRFEETPYNFRIGRLFPKVVHDIENEQRENGAFTCCAPFVFGALPADPVCSSFLVAGWQSVLFTGNLQILRSAYQSFAAWEDFLLSRSNDYIVDYSYYGDWAGPAYACESDEYAVSSSTPGILMSTGYSYYNCRLLAHFASLLGDGKNEEKYAALAQKIGSAFLAKWWHADTAKVAEGSQGSQAFTLWLGLVPKENCQAAADVLHRDLVEKNYKFTTGNLCTRYLMDMLTEYGYLEDAWKLLSSKEYPSYGYMIENEATTVWERFELKKNPNMNSHNHPMYGAVDYWFYAYLCGIKPLAPGFEKISIKPYYPQELLSAQGVVETPMGDVSVKWVKRYQRLYLYVTVPFGTQAEVNLQNEKTVMVGNGSYCFDWPLE